MDPPCEPTLGEGGVELECDGDGQNGLECGCRGPPGEPTNEPHRRGCTPPPGICVSPGEWYSQVGEPEYDWIEYDSGWYGLDLRGYGYPNWFETSYAVISRGEYAGRDWWSGTLMSIPTPIIEVQSVIEPH